VRRSHRREASPSATPKNILSALWGVRELKPPRCPRNTDAKQPPLRSGDERWTAVVPAMPWSTDPVPAAAPVLPGRVHRPVIEYIPDRVQCFARRHEQMRVVAVGKYGPRRDITLLSARAIRTARP